MQHRIYWAVDVDVVGDIVIDEGKVFVSSKMGDVPGVAGDEIVHRNDRVAFGQETITEMRANKASAASDEYTQWSDLPTMSS